MNKHDPDRIGIFSVCPFSISESFNVRILEFAIHESLSVFIRVHPRPIQSFVFTSLANKKSVFICVYLCPDINFLVMALPRCVLYALCG